MNSIRPVVLTGWKLAHALSHATHSKPKCRYVHSSDGFMMTFWISSWFFIHCSKTMNKKVYNLTELRQVEWSYWPKSAPKDTFFMVLHLYPWQLHKQTGECAACLQRHICPAFTNYKLGCAVYQYCIVLWYETRYCQRFWILLYCDMF